MSLEQLVQEAKRLQLSEQLQLVEELLRSFRTQMVVTNTEIVQAAPMSAWRGALKPADGALPTDEDLTLLLSNSLLEKHA